MSKNPRPIEQLHTDIPRIEVSFDPEAFDLAVRAHGVHLVHYSGLRCPVGMTDLDDNRRPHEDHQGCSNGFLYEKVGTLQALLIGNGNQPQLRDIGFVDGASFMATFPRTYNDCEKPFMACPFDRFYLDEENIVVPTWQTVLHHESGVDRLSFPVVAVERCVDSRGDSFFQGEDFDVVRGQLHWKADGRRPAPDLETGRGAVISVRWTYRPFFYIARMMHEIRVAQVDNPVFDDPRQLIRMPQQALLHREFLFTNEQKDEQALDARSPRQQQGPAENGFGPR